MSNISPLKAISAIDGRYWNIAKPLTAYFSEEALMKYRVRVEIEYFKALCNIPLPQLEAFPHSAYSQLDAIVTDFSEANALEIKEIEKTTNHDVKAVEYFIKGRFEKLGLQQFSEFIHFGLTSQDINNTAIPLALKEYLEQEFDVQQEQLLNRLGELADQWKDIPMLARTHGQPASPTRLGKELDVFFERLNVQFAYLETALHSAKFGGATGNFNAHKVAYPNIDWHAFADNFIDNTLGLDRSYPTTQIEHYDSLAAICHTCSRINTILIDLCRDMWTYISMDYFKQKLKEGEVGSSAMPHKVNPIDFENAEGNLGIANALFEHLAAKLPISRLQRDLTDSTVLRNLGVPFAHSYVAIVSLTKGLNKLLLNEDAINADLERNWAVVAEAVQTILRREGFPKPYEALKALTRTNDKITQQSMHSFIDTLEVSDAIKTELKAITPFNYTGA
jgi:adenylosuccinate lyase